MSINLYKDWWDLSDIEAHLLLLHLQENQDEIADREIKVLSFIHHHFIFVIDLSPSVFSVAADGDYVLYDAIIASLFSVLRRLLVVAEGWKETEEVANDPVNREIRISVVGFSTVHTPNARQAFLLCAPLTEETLKYLNDKIIEYIRLLVQQYAPIAQNWLIGDTDEQVCLIPGLFESDTSGEEDNFSQTDGTGRRNKPTLELGTSDIAMIDQLRIAHKAAQLTVGKARTVAIFVTDGVTDLPTPSVTDYLISLFRCSGVPCCFVLATSSDPANQRKRVGLAPSSYFAHVVDRALLDNIAVGTNGIVCNAFRQTDGTFDVGEKLIECLLYERIPCVDCHSFDSQQPQIIRIPFRKAPVTVTVYPLVSARFAHGFKKCRSTRPELSSDLNLCLKWHPNITIRYRISQTALEVWWECEAALLQAVYPEGLDVESVNTGNDYDAEEEGDTRPALRQTIASQIGKDLFRYLSRLAAIDDLMMKIYNTNAAALPTDPVLRALPVFVFIPKDRQLAAHESLRYREIGGKKGSSGTAEADPNEVEDISQFLAYWRIVATMNAASLKLIYTTRNLQYFLNYDRPLPKVLLTASSPGVGPAPRQTSALSCRLALNNVVTFLRTNWASFELVENRAFVKFISTDPSSPTYCVIRISDRLSPVASISVSFLRGTEKSIIESVLNELCNHFSESVLSFPKHTDITAMSSLLSPLDTFLVEPNAWLADFSSSAVIPEYRTMLASIEHSLPARVRPMTNATLLSRMYRADRVVFELVMPGGMAPRGIFNRVIRSFIKRKLNTGYRFSSASSSFLSFCLEVENEERPAPQGEVIEDPAAPAVVVDEGSYEYLKPLIQFNLSYSVEECSPNQNNQLDGSNEAKGDDNKTTESRPHSAATTLQPPLRRSSMAVGVSSVDTVLFRIVTELWILPVGVNDNSAYLDKIIIDTHKQDFQLICKLYTYFAFRLVSVIANSQKSLIDKGSLLGGFALPPSTKWFWNPPEISPESGGGGGGKASSVLDLLSHPVVTLSARPDLFQLLSTCQETKIRVPLLRCSNSSNKLDRNSPENVQAATILRDLVEKSLGERFPYQNNLLGHGPRPRDEFFIPGKEGDKTTPTEWTLFTFAVDRPEHIMLAFVPNEIESWLGSPDTSSANSYISLYLYVSVFDWLFLPGESREIRSRPADLTIDVAEEIFVTENSDKSKTPLKSRINSSNNNDPADNSTFIGDMAEPGSMVDTFLLGSVQGLKLADAFASVYVSAVYRCLVSKLPICSTDFELAVSSLCTESVCSEIDLKQLLLLHGTTCPEGRMCVSPGEERLQEVIAQWFQPVPCAPHYYFFRVPESAFSEAENSSFRRIASLSESFDAANWQQQLSSSPGFFDADNQSPSASEDSSLSGSEVASGNEMEEEKGEDQFSEEEEHDITASDDPSQPPPPLFLHCTCSITVKPPDGDNKSETSLIHIPLSSLPHCLRGLLAASDEVDHSMSSAEMMSLVVSVTLDVICIAPNPMRLPTSVASTPVHRNAPLVNLANAMPATDGGGTSSSGAPARRNFRRRMSSVLVRDSDGIGYFQTLSLHPIQYTAVSVLVKQFHWLVFDDMIMSVSSSDLDLQQLALHVVETLRMRELSNEANNAAEQPQLSAQLPSFCPIVKRKRRSLAFVYGAETSQSVLAETLTGYALRTASAIIRRLGNTLYFYCAIPVRSTTESASAISSTPNQLEPPTESSIEQNRGQPMNAISEGDLSSSAKKQHSKQQLPSQTASQHVLLPHLRRRHQSAAPLVPLRPPPMFARPRRLSSSRRQVETASPPLGLFAPSFLSPQKSTGGESLSTTTSSPHSAITGRGYESDNEFNELGNEKDLDEFHFTAASPVGVHTSQTCWIFCKISKKCRFYLYVPWLSKNTEKSQCAFSLLSELIEAVDKSVRRTNQQLLLRDMHATQTANRLILQAEDTGPEATQNVKLADELSLPPEHFACPVQYTHRFNLHPSLRLGATSHHMISSNRPNMAASGLTESMNAASTPAGRALTVISGVLQNVALGNRPDVFTYRQTRERPLSDLLYYLVFTSGQYVDDRSDFDTPSERMSTVTSSSGVEIPLGSSVIQRDISAPLAASLSRPSSRQNSTDASSVFSLSLSQTSSSQAQWWLDLHVHGLDPPSMSELEKLITALQHALDKAVLQNLLSSLLKNPMHRLTPNDVDFIQHSPQPTQIFYALPPLIAQSCPHTWFAYFRQSVLSGAYNFSLPHFSFVPGSHSAGETTSMQSVCRFRDTSTTPPGPLDPTNTFLFFTRLESALSGIACIEAKILSPTTGEPSTIQVDWLKILTSSAPTQIVSEHLRGFKKSDSRFPSEWCLNVRVWERGTVISDLELALERCISSAICDTFTEGTVAALTASSLGSNQRPSVGAVSTNSSNSSTLSSMELSNEETVASWVQLKTFLDYVSTQLTPPAPLTVKKIQIPLMRVGLWLDAACRSLSPFNNTAGLSASGGGLELSFLAGARLYSSNNNPDCKFSSVLLKETRNIANSYRKLAKIRWLVLSSTFPSDWKKHSPISSSVQVSRQCFAVIDVHASSVSSCTATVLLYNVIPQRIENVLSELEATAKISEFQIRAGSDIVLQKAGLFAAQHFTTERPSTTVYEVLNVLTGKIEIVKQVSSKSAPRNMPGQSSASKQDSWMQIPYSRVVLRDQIALPYRSKIKESSASGYLTDVFLEFCRQISIAAESIHRRREAVIFAGKIVTSLENPSEDTSSSAIGQLQQTQQQSQQQSGLSFRNPNTIATAAKNARNRAKSKRQFGRLQAIRSSSSSVATLDSTAMNILRHSCRLQHFVSAPLVLSPKWCQFAMQRAANILSVSQQAQALPSVPVEELGLYIWFRDEYIAYIQRSLFLFELSVTNTSAPVHLTGHHQSYQQQLQQQAIQTAQQQHTTPGLSQFQHTQPVFSFLSTPGGLILVQCDLRGVDLHVRLYTWERYRASTSAMARFSELVDRCRTMTHLHSFCYDQHVRIVQSWILDGQSVLPQTYDHAEIIRNLCHAYRRTPLYASSLICSGKTEISGLRFTTVRELISRLGSSNYDLFDETFDLKVRDIRETEVIQGGSVSESGSNTVPELVLSGKERTSEPIICTTVIATIRPVVYSENGMPVSVSDSDVEILYAVATTTKRWKELFPVETRALRYEELASIKARKKREITPDLMALARAVPRYRPQIPGGDFIISLLASSSLRVLVLTCYRQGLAESQWRRITSAADVLQLQSPGGPNRHELLTCADLRALTMDVSTAPSRLADGEALNVSMGCQALPLSIVDSRLARLRLASPSPSLARSLRQRFPLTVWLPGPPTTETRPEFTLIIAPDRLCAVVIAWPIPQPSGNAPLGPSSTMVSSPVPQSSLKISQTTPIPGVKISGYPMTTTPELAGGSSSGSQSVAAQSPSSSAASSKKPLTLEAAEMFFLARNPNAMVIAAHDSSKPGSPIEIGLPMQHTFSLYSNPSHRLFTESIISCLAADYIRHLLDRATPGKP